MGKQEQIVRRKTPPVWFSVILDFGRTKTLRRLGVSVILVGLYTAAVDYAEVAIFHIEFKPPSTVFSLLGIVLGLLLVFRTNTAYDRWWEGRKLLSSLGYNAKNLAMKLNAYLPKNDEVNRAYFAKMIVNHAYAMKENLRNGVKFEELQEIEPGYFDTLRHVYHIPNQICSQIVERINKLYIEGRLTDPQLRELSQHADKATEIVSSCERIKTTPVPFSYSIHLKKFIFFFTIILPFGFIQDLGYWCVIVIMIIFYALVGLEAIGEEIEDPFGMDENDLPIDHIVESLHHSVDELLMGVHAEDEIHG